MVEVVEVAAPEVVEEIQMKLLKLSLRILRHSRSTLTIIIQREMPETTSLKSTQSLTKASGTG